MCIGICDTTCVTRLILWGDEHRQQKSAWLDFCVQ